MNGWCCSLTGSNKNVTFAQFVHYVVWNHKHNVEANHHWRSQYDLCQPCHINYDSIGYYETLHDDVDYILGKIGVGQNIHLVPRSKDTKQISSNYYLNLFDAVPTSDIVGLLDMYNKDYKVFGYELPERIRNRL